MLIRRSGTEPLWDPMGYPIAQLRGAVHDAVSALDLSPGTRVLDYGCGDKPYRSAFGPEITYLGADLPENDEADVQINGGVVDLPDGSVDLIISTQVLEHVPDPNAYLVEARRLLRPGGRVLLTTHGVMFYHPHPTDFWRWTADGLTTVMTRARLRTTSVTPVLGAVPLGLWLVMMNLQAKLPRGLRHVIVSLFNLAIRWTNRLDWNTYRADFVYVVLAESEPPDGRSETA